MREMQRRDGFRVEDLAAADHSHCFFQGNTLDVDNLVMIEFALGAGQIARKEERDTLVAKTRNSGNRAEQIPLARNWSRLLAQFGFGPRPPCLPPAHTSGACLLEETTGAMR